MEQAPKTIRYHYIKSTAFRVVHADGVYGGVSPKGDLHLDFFSERFPIPQLVEHTLVDPSGDHAKVGAEVSRVARDGLIREVEVGVVLDIDTATALKDWLTDHIDKWSHRGETGNAE